MSGTSISAWCAVAQLGEQSYNRVASSSLARTFQRTAICGNSFTYSQKFCEWHTLVFESQAQNRVHVETALIFITPAARHATDGRHLRRIMCVKQCDCNNCYKKKTCADCQYCFENKDVDCNTKGIQGCKYKIDYPESEDKKYCCTCKWYAEFEGVCCCGDSKFRADFRCLDDTCPEWMSKESES